MRFLTVVGALAIVAAIAGAIYFFGGYYNVAATEPDLGIVEWALTHVREASVEKHSKGIKPPISLDDSSAIMAGAKAYSTRGCVNCHGGPGADWAKFSEGLHPSPPDLKDVVKDLDGPQLFWVIKNGINMTGMPGFGLIQTPDQEIWTIVAFVKKIATVSPEDFKAWTTPASTAESPSQTH